jgi:hypothetical protein
VRKPRVRRYGRQQADKLSVIFIEKGQSTYILSSDATIDQDLDQSDDGVDAILVENEKLGIPAFGEDLFSCSRRQ